MKSKKAKKGAVAHLRERYIKIKAARKPSKEIIETLCSRGYKARGGDYNAGVDMVWVGRGNSILGEDCVVKQGEVYHITGCEPMLSDPTTLFLTFINRDGLVDSASERCFVHVAWYKRMREKYFRHILPPVDSELIVRNFAADFDDQYSGV
jgi:hypothetical protein